jgi:hypothetical protein
MLYPWLGVNGFDIPIGKDFGGFQNISSSALAKLTPFPNGYVLR